jgi:triosephosphate isomerase
VSSPGLPLIVGNWKMHGLGADLTVARQVAASLRERPARARVAICPPDTLIARMAAALNGTDVLVGGQNIRPEIDGAFTGDVSAEMLADAGARLVILGHSERRSTYGETDAMVAQKVRAAWRGGLEPIVCVGESAAERRAGRAVQVISDQLSRSLPPELGGPAFAVAYEPIWAIGSGETADLDQIEEAHAGLRHALLQILGEAGRAVPILYGGSATPDNAASTLGTAEVGGALVGGASLQAQEFLAIIRASGDFAPKSGDRLPLD